MPPASADIPPTSFGPTVVTWAPGRTQSRGLKLQLDLSRMTATAVTQYLHSPPLLATFAGNVQQLSNFDEFVGWGQAPYFTEYDASGRLLLDGRFVGDNASYRAYRFRWVGLPKTLPAVSVSGTRGQSTVYVSWNGATQVARWRVLSGSSATALRIGTTAARSGFETAIRVPSASYFAVQGLDGGGHVLGQSITVRPH